MDTIDNVTILIQDVHIISDVDAFKEIREYVAQKNRWVSIAELAETTVLPFDQIERLTNSECAQC